MSRTDSSIKNLTSAMIGQVFALIISFVARIVFLNVLNEQYLGLNGLFTNILTVFSLVELGVGPAMNFCLYKPLAENDTEQVKSLMSFYRNAYNIIGVAIAIIGVGFVPFYRLFMAQVPDIPNLTLIYLLFTANTVASYFFAYKRALIICDEKRYVSNFYRYTFFSLLNIAQIFLLLTTGNYILFLVLQVIFTLAENIFVSLKADKMYPYLTEKNVQPVSNGTLSDITKNVKAMLMHKIGTVLVLSTDNIILSKYVGIVAVGIYSNYYLIISALQIVLYQVFDSIIASIGNLNAVSGNRDGRLEKVFDRVFFLNFWIFALCSCCLAVLFNPFISLWLGDHLLFDNLTVAAIVINFYLTGMRKTANTFKEATGLFYYDRYKPIFESVINIAASVYLAVRLGAAGVLLGTIISTLATCIWVEPYVVYRHSFKKGVGGYLVKLIAYSALCAGVCRLTLYTAGLITSGSRWFRFILKALTAFIIPNIIFMLVFFRNENFRYYLKLLNPKNLASKIKQLIG